MKGSSHMNIPVLLTWFFHLDTKPFCSTKALQDNITVEMIKQSIYTPPNLFQTPDYRK